MIISDHFSELLKDAKVSIINKKPIVLAAYESDFEKNSSTIVDFIRDNSQTTILLQIGFEHETERPSSHLAEVISNFNDMTKNARVIVLCNSENECNALGNKGVETRFIHQNCFLDERRYRPLPGKRIYDAAYIARVTPFKRHTLIPVEIAPKLLLMGTSSSPSEQEYSEMIHQRLANAHWVRYFNSVKISEYLAQAKCGLVLSACEGASFCSSEYLMCGLPIVDTPALGGRSVLYPEEYVKYVESTPDSIREGIEYWATKMPNPDLIRKGWLEKVKPHREEWNKLMLEITGRKVPFKHKLGIRVHHAENYFSIAVQMYLLGRRIINAL